MIRSYLFSGVSKYTILYNVRIDIPKTQLLLLLYNIIMDMPTKWLILDGVLVHDSITVATICTIYNVV